MILDRDLAVVYGVTTKRLNEQVKRNRERFPEDFMFELTAAESECSRSQTATLSRGRGQNLKYLPRAFTEHGAIQAANVLSSSRAIAMSIHKEFYELIRQLMHSPPMKRRGIGFTADLREK